MRSVQLEAMARLKGFSLELRPHVRGTLQIYIQLTSQQRSKSEAWGGEGGGRGQSEPIPLLQQFMLDPNIEIIAHSKLLSICQSVHDFSSGWRGGRLLPVAMETCPSYRQVAVRDVHLHDLWDPLH